MSALADVLRGSGCVLSGSDCAAGAEIDATKSAWIRAGHAAAHVPPDCDLLVYSPAVPEDNVELVGARRIGVPTLSYPQMLGRLMSQRRGLAVAGTHGKSTTTAMTAAILAAADLDATVIIGAAPQGMTSGGRHGTGPMLLAEACEYRSHFHCLRPEVAVLLGIEWDHVDCFPTLAHLEAAFGGFVAGVARDGLVIAAEACPVTRRVVARADRRCELFGVGPAAAWRAIDLRQALGRYQFTIQHHERSICSVALQTPGRHNVLNALAAAALAWHSGANAAAIQAGLNGFRGLKRRLEWLGEVGRVAVVDDYAHHPTEVAASLAALRAWFGKRRLWCVFQPHQAARTRALLDEFAGSMHNADRVIVAEVFLAREPAEAAGRACERRELGSSASRRTVARWPRFTPRTKLKIGCVLPCGPATCW